MAEWPNAYAWKAYMAEMSSGVRIPPSPHRQKMNKKILNHFKKHDPVIYSYAIKVGKLEEIKKDRPENYFKMVAI